MLRRRWGWVAAALCAATLSGCHDFDLTLRESASGIAVYDDLYAVSVIDDKRVVAVGYYGAAYVTNDGGESWKKGDTGTLLSLYGVSMADEKHGWAVGQSGLVLRTEDGGLTWSEQPNLKRQEGPHLFAVSAIDKNTAWAVGTWGTRILTEDAGKTWVDHSFTIDDQHPQFVWLTPVDQDRVRSGQKVYEDVGLNDIECLPAPSTQCWLIGEFGYVFYSNDRGATWERASIEGSIEPPPIEMAYNELDLDDGDIKTIQEFAALISGEEHLNVAIEAFANAQEIEAFGGAEDPSELFEILEARAQEVRTVLEEVGILSDRLRMRGQPPWDYEDFLEDDPEFLDRYLRGRMVEVPNVRLRVLQNPYLFTVRFHDTKLGLIAGLGGVVLRSVDGGHSWAYRKIDRKQALFAAAPVTGRAIAVGEKGLLRVSTDEGDSWNEPDSGTVPEMFTFMRDIDFEPSGRVGFIVGQTGKIMRSVDAGYAWQQVLPPPPPST